MLRRRLNIIRGHLYAHVRPPDRQTNRCREPKIRTENKHSSEAAISELRRDAGEATVNGCPFQRFLSCRGRMRAGFGARPRARATKKQKAAGLCAGARERARERNHERSNKVERGDSQASAMKRGCPSHIVWGGQVLELGTSRNSI